MIPEIPERLHNTVTLPGNALLHPRHSLSRINIKQKTACQALLLHLAECERWSVCDTVRTSGLPGEQNEERFYAGEGETSFSPAA